MKVPLRAESAEPSCRTDEPTTFGLPWPRGAVSDDRLFHLTAANGTSAPLQTEVLARWADGSIRWCLFDAQLTTTGNGDTGYAIEVREMPRAPSVAALQVESAEGNVTIRTGRNAWAFVPGDDFLCEELELELHEVGPDSLPLPIEIVLAELSTNGTLRATVAVEAMVPMEPVLKVRAVVDLYANHGVARIALSLTNTAAADHPGGNWDLGNGGSFYPGLFIVKLSTPTGETRVSPERAVTSQAVSELASLYQDSSGGENWKSSNHLNRNRIVPHEFCGYKFENGNDASDGLRATPVLTRIGGSNFRGLTMPYFWENFPAAVSAAPGRLTLELYPRRGSHQHELQGGEQKTWVFFASLAADAVTAEPMQWCRSPIRVSAAPEWYCAAGVFPEMVPRSADPNADYLKLVDLALDGNDTFLTKRETIDEYGVRHFGDLYGDHEAVYHRGPTPMISHYNNQYDCVLALIQHWMRSGDPRSLAQGLECANHTIDTDLYHTEDDKSAYNGGLFWHTYHYADADTGNHRSYPRSLKRGGHFDAGQDLSKMGETGADLQKVYAVGGGPAGSHNYNAGLMIAYCLTGEMRYREAALQLADFVISIDDPKGTKFKYLSHEFTGLASESGYQYHGPGRATANSILALLVGYTLTNHAKYLLKCEELIRRVVHPKQNPAALDLLNAESRWYYTMTLQALGEYLDHKAERGQLDRTYAYARLTLLHYARWMATHERPILDAPQKLQYPTETWAAQDLRKVEVFQFAAKHAEGDDRMKFLERADWFFRTSVAKLHTFETKSLCRPVILAMRYGWSRAAWQADPNRDAPPPSEPLTAEDFGGWSMFVPQKAKAIRRAKMLAVIGAIAAASLFLTLIVWLLR